MIDMPFIKLSSTNYFYFFSNSAESYKFLSKNSKKKQSNSILLKNITVPSETSRFFLSEVLLFAFLKNSTLFF